MVGAFVVCLFSLVSELEMDNCVLIQIINNDLELQTQQI